MADIIEQIRRFSLLPFEVQQACVYQFQNRSEKADVAEQKPVKRKKVKRKNDSSQRPWTQEDRRSLFCLFDKYGWDNELARKWAEEYRRTVGSIRGQYDIYCKARR
jgi:hypothetical protein